MANSHKSRLEHMTQPVPGAGITILGIASAADKMRHFCLLIQNVLQEWVWTHVGCFNLEKVKSSDSPVWSSIWSIPAQWQKLPTWEHHSESPQWDLVMPKSFWTTLHKPPKHEVFTVPHIFWVESAESEHLAQTPHGLCTDSMRTGRLSIWHRSLHNRCFQSTWSLHGVQAKCSD